MHLANKSKWKPNSKTLSWRNDPYPYQSSQKNDIYHFHMERNKKEKKSFRKESTVSTEFSCLLLHFPGDTRMAATPKNGRLSFCSFVQTFLFWEILIDWLIDHDSISTGSEASLFFLCKLNINESLIHWNEGERDGRQKEAKRQRIILEKIQHKE